METSLFKKSAAEFIGTFWLVLGGCGTAVFAATFPETGVGFLGVALAFGLTVLTGIYALGHISGGHFNPAVSVGLWLGGRFSGKDLIPYIIAQVLGGIAAGAILMYVLSGQSSFAGLGNFACDGYGIHSPGGYSLGACAVTEIVLTCLFLIVIMGATHKNANSRFAGIAIGLCLTLIHLISIPITNTSVNPARSLGVAVFQGDWAMGQVWLFWVAPIVGGAIGGIIYKVLAPNKD